jgi:hypothetical protein
MRDEEGKPGQNEGLVGQLELLFVILREVTDEPP